VAAAVAAALSRIDLARKQKSFWHWHRQVANMSGTHARPPLPNCGWRGGTEEIAPLIPAKALFSSSKKK